MKKKIFIVTITMFSILAFTIIKINSRENDLSNQDIEAAVQKGTLIPINVDKASKISGINFQTGEPIEEVFETPEGDEAKSLKNATLRKDQLLSPTAAQDAPIVQKVLTIIYDTHELPCCSSFPYRISPSELNVRLARDIEESTIELAFKYTNGKPNVRINLVDTIIYKSRAPQKNGVSTVVSGTFDYNRMLTENHICERINNNEIDEVWMWADQTGGFWEATMAGPANQIFNTNSVPLVRTDCNRAVNIMGFNYERFYDKNKSNGEVLIPSSSSALHSFNHRIENTVALFLDNSQRYSLKTGMASYEFFGRDYKIIETNMNYSGNTHWPPNALTYNDKYHYWDLNFTYSSFGTWSMSNKNRIKKSINCTAWHCFEEYYQKMWMQQLPGKDTSGSMKKPNNQPLPNIWYAVFKNGYYYESAKIADPKRKEQCGVKCFGDSRCSIINDNKFCATSYTSSADWQDVTSNVNTISYKEQNKVKQENGKVTDINIFYAANGKIEQHLVKNGKVFYREFVPNVGWDSYWQNVTSNLINVGCDLKVDCGGIIIGFNSYKRPDEVIEQHVIRKNSSSSTIYSRVNTPSWTNWVDVSSNTASVGSGILTSITTFVHKDNYLLQNFVKNGQIWERNNNAGWSIWRDVTDRCGSICTDGKVVSIERVLTKENNLESYITKEDGKMYYLSEIPDATKLCRLKSNPLSATCEL